MNAIILSREDADKLCNYSRRKWIHLLEIGTPGYSWLTVAPDEILEYLSLSVFVLQDTNEGGYTEFEESVLKSIDAERDRRKNLKSTKD